MIPRHGLAITSSQSLFKLGSQALRRRQGLRSISHFTRECAGVVSEDEWEGEEEDPGRMLCSLSRTGLQGPGRPNVTQQRLDWRLRLAGSRGVHPMLRHLSNLYSSGSAELDPVCQQRVEG